MVARICTLCGLPAHHPVRGEDGAVFCCSACREVSALLAEAPPADGRVEAAPGAETAALTLQLAGLYCPSCAWLIEARLKQTPGVRSAAVSYIRREAQLTYDPRTSPDRIVRRIRSLGYKAGPAAETGEEEEAFFTRLLIGGMLAMHIMAVSAIIYVRGWLGLNGPDTRWLEEFFHLMQFVLSIPLLLVLGLPVLRAGMAGLLHRLPNTHTLVTLGVVSALALSTRNLFAGSGHVYFDTAAMLLFLLTAGRWLELKSHRSGREAVEALLERIPQTALRVKPDGDETVPLDSVRAGMRVRVLPGGRIPVDGIVAQGRGDLDESPLTGEPGPVFRSPGDPVWAGTLSLDGAFEIIARAAGADTRLGQIGEMLQQALWLRSPAERLADRVAAWLVPGALAVAAGTFAFWYAHAGLEAALLNALSVLLIACPCALGLATPLTLWQALTRAARNGIVLRSTGAFEKLTGIRQVFFDKTGTLTRLPMRVVSVFSPGVEEADFLQRIAAAEAHSEHPIAHAVVDRARSAGLAWDTVEDFKAYPGQGVAAIVSGTQIRAGSRAFLNSEGMAVPADLAREADRLRGQGLSVIYAGWEDQAVGLVGLGETARPEVRAVLAALHHRGRKITVLTGDDAAAGDRWQERLGVEVLAGLSPEAKLVRLRDAAGAAMVGDGINDGPALAAAEIGIALAGSTDVARSAAEVVLVREDLRLIPWLLDLAQEAGKRLRQNLAWALVYNLVGVGLAVFGLLRPELAAIAMVASSVLVTQNALRLGRFPAPVETHPSPERLPDAASEIAFT